MPLGLYVQFCYSLKHLLVTTIGSVIASKTHEKNTQALFRSCINAPCLSAVAFWNGVPFDEISPELLLQISLSPLWMSAVVLTCNSHVPPGVFVRVILGAGELAVPWEHQSCVWACCWLRAKWAHCQRHRLYSEYQSQWLIYSAECVIKWLWCFIYGFFVVKMAYLQSRGEGGRVCKGKSFHRFHMFICYSACDFYIHSADVYSLSFRGKWKDSGSQWHV